VLRVPNIMVAAVATVICPNDEGRTPLHIAYQHSNVKVNSEHEGVLGLLSLLVSTTDVTSRSH
jgi:hypothetical protein